MSFLKNPFSHPSVMLRHEVLHQHQLHYDTNLRATQDYDLWTRMLKYTDGANLDKLLTDYRKSESSITADSRTPQLKNHDLTAFRTIRDCLPKFRISREQVNQLRRAFVGGDIQSRERKEQRVKFAALYLDLLSAFVAQYSRHPGIQDLRRCETIKIALLGVRLPRLSYWGPILKRACQLYPGSIFPIFAYIIKKHFWKRGRRTVQRLLHKCEMKS